MNETQAGFYETSDGGRLYYETAGSGVPVVLIHGFTLDTRMWDDQWEPLAERYRVIRYDVRGFGRSSLPAGPYSNFGDLKALLEHLGVERPQVVGLSMGGGIAFDFAVTYPDALRSLVVIDSALGGFPSFAASLNLDEAAKKLGLAAAILRWAGSDLFAPARERPEVARWLNEIVRGYSGYRWLQHDPQVLPDPPPSQRLGEITVPTLAIVGERDLALFHEIAGFVAENVPGARQEVVAGAGHMSNMEAPQAVNRLLLDFLAAK